MTRKVAFITIIALSNIMGCMHVKPGPKARSKIVAKPASWQHGGPPTRIDYRVESLEFRSMNIFEAITMDVPPIKNLSFGLVYYEHFSLQRPKHRKFSLKFQNSTMREVLTKLVAADGKYEVLIEGDIANFVPREELPNARYVRRILEERLSKFKVVDATMHEAIAILTQLARKEGISGIYEVPMPQYPRSGIKKITVSVENASIRQCLNAIVAADPPSVWLAVPYPTALVLTANPKLTYSLSDPEP